MSLLWPIYTTVLQKLAVKCSLLQQITAEHGSAKNTCCSTIDFKMAPRNSTATRLWCATLKKTGLFYSLKDYFLGVYWGTQKVFPFWVILLSTAQTSFRMVDQSLELKIQRIWKSPQCVHQESYWVREPHPPVLFWLMMITGVPSILIVRSSWGRSFK